MKIKKLLRLLYKGTYLGTLMHFYHGWGNISRHKPFDTIQIFFVYNRFRSYDCGTYVKRYPRTRKYNKKDEQMSSWDWNGRMRRGLLHPLRPALSPLHRSAILLNINFHQKKNFYFILFYFIKQFLYNFLYWIAVVKRVFQRNWAAANSICPCCGKL